MGCTRCNAAQCLAAWPARRDAINRRVASATIMTGYQRRGANNAPAPMHLWRVTIRAIQPLGDRIRATPAGIGVPISRR